MSSNNGKDGQMMDNKGQGVSTDTIIYRLGAMETQVKEIRTDLKSVQTEIIVKLDIMAKGFATHKDIDNAKVQAELEHRAIYKKIEDVEFEVSATKRRNWISNTMSAAFGVLLTLLITYAFTSIIK